VAARTTAVQIYRELKEKDSQLSVPYFDALSTVADNSFLREYVWTYLHEPEWSSPPGTLHLVDFMHWRAEHLAQHAVVTKGRVVFAANGKAPAEPSAKRASELPVLVQGRKVMERGEPELAIAAFYDPVIEHFARTYRDSGKRVYAARSQTQMFIYVALPNEEKKPIEVLDSTWSDAYLMKAYALTELRKLDASEAALQKAIELSPLTAQYILELAYVYQARGECDRSIETYKQAESAAKMASDDATKKDDLTRALRGQGYCLVEEGRLDEAEALYRKSLALDPSDMKAMGELEYIKKKRSPKE
jgi:tetratricopeptide (TPR) repeat protein